LLKSSLPFKRFATAERVTNALAWLQRLTAREGLSKEVLEAAIGVLDELEGDEASKLKKGLQLRIQSA
jgi:uncharacterized protein YqhQ